MGILLLGYICIIIIGSIRVGGISEAFSISNQGGRIVFDEFDPDPTTRSTFYSQILGGTLLYLTYCASNQAVSQKYCSVDKLSNAKKASWLLVLASIVYLTLVCIIGIIMYAYYVDCDPQMAGRIVKSDQMLPLFVMDIMGNLHGLPGLFMATVFSAALSTTSGCLNALTAITLTDYIPPLYALRHEEPMSERAKSILTRVLVLFFGVMTIGLGFIAPYMGDSVNQIALSIYGFVGGPLTAMITLGVFLPFVNAIGALSGLICSLGISSWVAIGTILAKLPADILPLNANNCSNITYSFANLTTPIVETNELWIYDVSYMHYSFIAFVTSFVVAIPISLITGRTKNLDPRLWYNFRKSFCKSCRKGSNSAHHENNYDGKSISSKSSSSFNDEKRIIDELSIKEESLGVSNPVDVNVDCAQF